MSAIRLARGGAALLALLLMAPAQALAQASPSPYTNATRYDGLGRVTGTIAADPDTSGPLHHAAVRNSYDGAGRLIRVETGELAAWQSEAVAPSGWAGFTIYRTAETDYDASGRKTRETLRDGAGGVAGTIRSVTQYSYTLDGRPDCTAIRMNPAVFASLPASACTPGTAASDGPDRITRNIYDAAGQRLQLREGVGSADEGTEATWAYNLNGQVATVIDGNGNRADLHYDGYGRQDRWTFPSATRAAAFDDATPATALASAGSVDVSLYEAYQYDPNGNRTSLRKRDGSTLAYSYDALNRVTLKDVPGRADLTAAQTRDVYYSYDLRGLQRSVRFDSQAGEGVTNTYDGFGRLTRSIFDIGGIPRQLDYGYDRNGNRESIAHADGNVAFNTVYDGVNRPRQLLANGTTNLASTSYTPYGAPALTLRIANQVATALGYDGVLRPTVRVHYFTPGTSNAVWSYGFNAASQLSSAARDNDAFAWTDHYAVNRPYTTNGLNQYSAAGEATFGYDLNGNLVLDGKRTYVYDIENRLVSATPLPGSDAVAADLVYDPLGRLFQVTSPITGTRRFLYDGDALVAEYDGANQIAKRHAHWPGADVPMVTYQGDGLATIRQLLADHQGSIVALADASGAAVQINRYDEYGIPGAGNAGRFQYTGQAWLDELGMYYYKARIYSPTLGRFMQTDPVGYTGGINLYAYVRDDPVNLMDPDGQQALPLIGLCVGPQAAVCAGVILGGTAVAGCAASAGCREFVGQVLGSLFPTVRGSPTIVPGDSGDRRGRPVAAPISDRRSNEVTVYRLHGGQSGPNGRSWTTVDPRSMANPRDRLGLPDGNTAQQLDIGTLVDRRGVEFRRALPLGENSQGPNRGGAPEVMIPDPANQVRERRSEPFRDPSPSRRQQDPY